MDSGGCSVCLRSPILSKAGEWGHLTLTLGLWPVAALSEEAIHLDLRSAHLLPQLSCRLPLPEAWRGLRDEALDQVSGIPGCIFVHASGFIGGHHTREGALSMARATLTQRSAPVPPTDP